MNDTPTPRTDELYRDHMSDPYQDTGDLAAIMHIQCERFERELTAVTEQRDRLAEAFHDMLNDTLTPTNDEWIVTDNENYIEIASIKTCDSIASVHGGKTIGDQYDLAGRIARVPQLERELAAARQELKAVTEQRDKYHDYWESFGEERIKLKTELAAVTEQRDRLAEALESIIGEAAFEGIPESKQQFIYEALQSLNPDHTVDANDMIAVVKGGVDE